jgi:cytochrome c553
MTIQTIDRFTVPFCIPLLFIVSAGCAMGAPLDDGGSAADPDDSSSTTVFVEPDPPTEPLPEPEAARSVFAQYCASCHGAEGPGNGNIRFIADLNALVSNSLVVPGDPEASRVFQRMTDANNPMPPAAVAERPSAADIATIRGWINAGALPGEQACENSFVGFDEMFETMRSDIIGIKGEDRVHIRYLTLTHLHNAGMCERELDLYRDAIAKGVNSLSVKSKLEKPVPIDERDTIYRVDLRDYGWDNNPNFVDKDLWDTIAAVNPFAVAFEGDPADDVRVFSNTSIPFQPADSFLQIATGGFLNAVDPGPNLYYKILQIVREQPNGTIERSLDVLEQGLGVPDRAAAISAGEVFRVIVQDSGVSQNNRAYDRYDGSSFGTYYYRSYDFASESGDRNLFENPTDFVADGGEMIFTLPNGLQGYAISDQVDELVDVAPTNIVKDLGQRDATVRVGISCMACHAGGINARPDEFEAFYAVAENNFKKDERELIALLFSEPDDALATQQSDARQFQGLLEEIGITSVAPEPIYGVSQQFEANLTLARVAAEVGMTTTQFSFELGALNGVFDKLQYTTMTRDEFAGVYVESMCILLPGSGVLPEDCFRE